MVCLDSTLQSVWGSKIWTLKLKSEGFMDSYGFFLEYEILRVCLYHKTSGPLSCKMASLFIDKVWDLKQLIFLKSHVMVILLVFEASMKNMFPMLVPSYLKWLITLNMFVLTCRSWVWLEQQVRGSRNWLYD